MTQARHAQQGLPELKLHDGEHPGRRRRVLRGARWLALGVVLLLLLGLARTLFARWNDGLELAHRAHENAALHVRVVHPAAAASAVQLTLPGALQGATEAQIYARASGYVTRWNKDLGASVQKGEWLATLDIPEVQRQVDEAEANHQLARTAFERWTRLYAEDAVSRQELDEKTGAYRQTQAVLKRLRDQLAYGRVVAPFSGIVTRRNVNVGDLVNAGSAGASQALFTLAQVDHLHVYIYVPQSQANQVHVGDSVRIDSGRADGRPLMARIARSAGAIDPATRTLQMDVDVPNTDRALLPGAYVNVLLSLPASGTLTLPTNALLFNARGVQVACVENGAVHRREVTLGTDFGRVVEVRTGLAAHDVVILNPPDSVADGQHVMVQSDPAPVSVAAPAAASAAASAVSR